MHDCRDAFSAEIMELAARDERVCLVVNDSISSTKSEQFANQYPTRFFDVGIAEQNMVGVAAGLANGGYIPFVCAASCFLTGRALEQIKVDIAYSRANVKLCGFSAGVAYGALGPTHHSIEDIAWTRAIAGLTVAAPSDPVETATLVRAAYATAGPIFLRINRLAVPSLNLEASTLGFGKSQQIRSGHDVTLIGLGPMTYRLLAAADILERTGISSRVINMATVTPIDAASIERAARETGRIVTAEDHILAGGFGSAVTEVVVQTCPVPVLSLGFTGFAPIGSPEEIFVHFGLDATAMATRIGHWVKPDNSTRSLKEAA